MPTTHNKPKTRRPPSAAAAAKKQPRQRGGSAASDAVMGAVPRGAPAAFDNLVLPWCADGGAGAMTGGNGGCGAGAAWAKKPPAAAKKPAAQQQRGGFFTTAASVPAPSGLPSPNGYLSYGGMDPGASVHAPQLTFAARYPACLSGALIGPSGLAQQAGGGSGKKKKTTKKAAAAKPPCNCDGGQRGGKKPKAPRRTAKK
jgi:hypothetical protein